LVRVHDLAPVANVRLGEVLASPRLAVELANAGAGEAAGYVVSHRAEGTFAGC
jgi:hypothetical protein